jgi:hypothetical protein
MKNILERFEKLAAAHQLNADCMAAMRGLLQDAHTAGFTQHMDIAATHRDVQPAMVVRSETEPDGEEDERSAPSYASYAALHMAMHKMVKKTIRKELRRHTRAQKKATRKAAHKVIRAAATHPGAAALAE